MTCIVGIETVDGVLIGGDSAGVSGWTVHTRADQKVFRNGPAIFGFTSSFRMGQILRYHLTVPEPVEKDLDRYMATSFITAVRSALKDEGFAEVKNNQEQGGTFLVGIRKTLYFVDGDYQIGRSTDHYAACGVGADIALGSLYSTKGIKIPRERLRRALTAAEHFSIGVTRPFHYVAGAWDEKH
jgi:ATP-dependent protease HslVU (ClpYQ) peptidase subunit